LILFESRWQQMARLNGETLPTWDEPVVTVGPIDTLPHPGLGAWTGTDEDANPVYAYYTEDLDLYSFSGGGHSVPRGANEAKYETPVIKRPTAQSFENNYT